MEREVVGCLLSTPYIPRPSVWSRERLFFFSSPKLASPAGPRTLINAECWSQLVQCNATTWSVYVHASVMDRRLRSSYGAQLELKSLSLCWHFWGKTNRDRCEHSLVSGFVPETLLILQHKCKCYSPHAENYVLLAKLGVGGFITWKRAFLQKPSPPEKECYMYMAWGGWNIGLISPSLPPLTSPFSSAAPDASPCVPCPLAISYSCELQNRLGAQCCSQQLWRS